MWKLKGYTVDAFDQKQVVYNIWANTKNDLPSTMTDIGYGTALGFGSTAQTFDDSKEWRWNGTQWVEQTNGQEIEIGANDIVYDNTDSGMTATNVQDAIDEIHDTDETQDRELAELYGENANQQLEIDYAINTGSKNLFPITATSQTLGGITFTVNSDGTITANGTKTNNDWFYLSTGNSLAAGTYILSSGLAPQSDTNVRLIITTENSLGSAIMGTEGERQVHTKQLASDYTGLYYAIRIASGKTVNNLTFKPMIRRAEITDDTFQPYAPTNRELYETAQQQAIRYEDSAIIRLNQLSWSQTSSGTGMWIADCYTTKSIDTIVSVIITSFSALKPSEVTTLFTYIPSSVSGMHTVRLICDRNLTGISSNPTLYLRVFGYGYQTASTSTRTLSFNSPMKLNLNRNELDSNFDLLDSIPEEEEGEEDV